ncbi:hypothetical protein BGZ65_008659, partial [Modicella reniformis]
MDKIKDFFYGEPATPPTRRAVNPVEPHRCAKHLEDFLNAVANFEVQDQWHGSSQGTCMENQSRVSRKRKNSEEALNAGFKKALVSPASSSDVYRNNLGDPSILGSSQSSSHRTTSTPSHEQETSSVVSHDSISDLSLNHATTTNTSNMIAASVAVMTTMADLLTNAGDNSSIMAHSAQSGQNIHDQQEEHTDVAGISDEILRMQQLQEQISLSPSNNTQLTREQILESIASVSTMRMIFEESLKNNLASASGGNTADLELTTSTAQSSTVDATSVLMNLGDPSILATLKAIINPTGPSRSSDNSALGAHDSTKREAGVESEAGPSENGIAPPRNDTDAVTSDNPLHTKWLMATALKEK